MCKMCVKLFNVIIYLPWSPIFQKYFFQKRTPPSSVMLKYFKCDIQQILMIRIMNIFNQGPYKSQFCVKWVGALILQDNVLAITFTWQNESWFMSLNSKTQLGNVCSLLLELGLFFNFLWLMRHINHFLII